MQPILDLRHYHWIKRHGDLTAIGTWIRDAETNSWRPALVLIRTGDEQSEHCVPCIVTGDKIWVWTEEVGDDQKAAKMVASFLDPLRLPFSKANALKILSIVRWHIGDVLMIPPRPAEFSADQAVEGVVKLTNLETGASREKEFVGHA